MISALGMGPPGLRKLQCPDRLMACNRSTPFITCVGGANAVTCALRSARNAVHGTTSASF